jgi:hypothetical protein
MTLPRARGEEKKISGKGVIRQPLGSGIHTLDLPIDLKVNDFHGQKPPKRNALHLGRGM